MYMTTTDGPNDMIRYYTHTDAVGVTNRSADSIGSINDVERAIITQNVTVVRDLSVGHGKRSGNQLVERMCARIGVQYKRHV